MMGSFLTRGLVMALGYTYPAYECYKSVEKNKPEIEQLRFWCQYWILVAILTVFERIGGDAFISWLPMYSEAKLAFFVYLWYPKTSGTTYVYDTFLRPFVAKHEMEIDRNLMELRARAGDIALMSWQKAASYGQTRVFEILQFVASQSSRPRPAQQPQRAGVRQPPPATSSTNKSPATPTRAPAKQQSQPPAVGQPATSAAADQRHELHHEAVPKPAASTETVDAQTTVPDPVTSSDATSQLAVPSKATSQSAVPSKATSQSAVPSKEEVKEIESAPVQLNGSVDPPPQEKVMEEAIRVTRGRLRKTRAASNR